jgi:hypothetical protein
MEINISEGDPGDPIEVEGFDELSFPTNSPDQNPSFGQTEDEYGYLHVFTPRFVSGMKSAHLILQDKETTKTVVETVMTLVPHFEDFGKKFVEALEEKNVFAQQDMTLRRCLNPCGGLVIVRWPPERRQVLLCEKRYSPAFQTLCKNSFLGMISDIIIQAIVCKDTMIEDDSTTALHQMKSTSLTILKEFESSPDK